MGYVVLVLIACILAFVWLNEYVSNLAIMLWIQEQKIPLPGDEIKKHLIYAWQRVLRIK